VIFLKIETETFMSYDLIPTPMKLELNEQQKMIRNMVREFAEKEVAPLAAELDKTGEYPTKTLEKMAKLGLLGIIIPQEYGGAGLDTISYATVIEEISRKCASTGVITSVHNSLTAWPIMKYGTEEQKKKYLPILAKGEKIGAFAGTEPKPEHRSIPAERPPKREPGGTGTSTPSPGRRGRETGNIGS
jgi:alkylation response protein AidB-like acyl-CoA dehydrogenase